MPERQDFVQRLLAELRQVLAQVLKFREGGSHDAALATLLQAQERLFVRPAQEFMTLPIERQVRLLVLGETGATAREKCIVYATFLTEMGHTYQAKRQPANAGGVYQLALHVLLEAARQIPGPDSADLRTGVAAVRDLVPADQLGPEVAALLGDFDASGPPGPRPSPPLDSPPPPS